MCHTFYLFGTTCVGKDYFIETALDRYPNIFGAVQVGKEFRKRYPPEHFEGKGALIKTEDEAFDIFCEQWTKSFDAGKKYILVSGQPRLQSQVKRLSDFVQGKQTILFLWVPDEVIHRRIEDRFKTDDNWRAAAKQRFINDKIQLFDVLFTLFENQIPVRTVDPRYRSIDSVIDDIAHHGEMV